MDYFSSQYRFPAKKLEKIVFCFIFFIVGLGIYFSHYHWSFFEEGWVRDNGWVESLTIIGMIFCMLVNIYRVNILYPFRSNLFIVCTLLLAIAFFFGVGEKISWGQHLFGFQPLEFFVRYNMHGETNLYYLKFGDWKMGNAIFDQFVKPIIFFYFLLLPLLYEKWNFVKRLVDNLALPLPRLYHVLAYIVLVLLCLGMARERKSEILEFGACWIFLLIFCCPYNRKLFSRISFKR